MRDVQQARGTGKNRTRLLSALERKALWLSTWTIHNANHLRPNDDGLKIGGHQASSASLATIMTALYGAALRPEDRVAVKPHASPMFHALQYMFGLQTREQLENFRAFGGAQSYPSRTKDADDVDFSTGSVGLGVAQTLFASVVQDYVKAKGWAPDRQPGKNGGAGRRRRDGRGQHLRGPAGGLEIRPQEHLVGGRLQPAEPGRGDPRGTLGSASRPSSGAFGWDVVILKHGTLQQDAFAEPGRR
jgi:pyruvate dehydrogenase E1 component